MKIVVFKSLEEALAHLKRPNGVPNGEILCWIPKRGGTSFLFPPNLAAIVWRKFQIRMSRVSTGHLMLCVEDSLDELRPWLESITIAEKAVTQ